MAPIPPAAPLKDRFEALRPRPEKKDLLDEAEGGLEREEEKERVEEDEGGGSTPGKGTEGVRSRGLKLPLGISRAL